jgi:predicted HTH domain antitoxin
MRSPGNSRRLPRSATPGCCSKLAIALYAKGTLSLAEGAGMARLTRMDFSWEVGERGIPRHYGAEELAEDVTHARK